MPDVNAMYELQLELAEQPNAVLISGYIPNAPEGWFRLLSLGKMKELIGGDYKEGFVNIDDKPTTCRLKVNFRPSSWWQIDRDRARGLPEHLNPDTERGYIEMVDAILPDFLQAGYVRVASTTGRVLFDGVPLDSTGSRYWFQVDDATDQKGFGNRLKLHAAEQGYGFMKLDKNGKGVLWTVCDCSVFSPERIVYDGQPHVEGDRLTLAPPDITYKQGGTVDTSQVPMPTPALRTQLKREFNIKVSERGGVISVINNDYLTLDTPVLVQREGGRAETITVQQFYSEGIERLRCQSTFRESTVGMGR